MATPGPLPSPAAGAKGIDESLRQSMLRRLDEALMNTRFGNNKSGADLELSIFNKATNVETYKALIQKCFTVIGSQVRTVINRKRF